MRTAVISDLHLGAASGADSLRDPTLRKALLEELAGADRVVLLGDAVELRDLPLGAALNGARPFFEELGATLGATEVLLVPGNHDHRFAEPILDRLSLTNEPLRLEHLDDPSPGPAAQLDAWLGPARLRLAYPGVWLREDVYATHGHYMDVHLAVPRAECIAAALTTRLGEPVPASAQPADYERLLRPIYGLAWGIAQARPRRLGPARSRPSEAAWRLLEGSGEDAEPSQRSRRLAAATLRATFPLAIGAINRALRADFNPDISGAAISRDGIAAAAELATRLGVDGGHVLTGHTHRAGPNTGERAWSLPGGGQLHNTGNWVFASAFHDPGLPPGPYWPGTVTWIEGDAAPRRVNPLGEHSHAELAGLLSPATRR